MRLRRGERRILETLLNDTAGSGPVPIAVDQSLAIFTGVLTHADPLARLGVRALLALLEWAPFLMAGPRWWGRYTRRPTDERLAYLDAMRTSPRYLRRAMLKAIVSPIYVSHYGRPDAQRRLGYDAAAIGGAYRDAPAADASEAGE